MTRAKDNILNTTEKQQTSGKQQPPEKQKTAALTMPSDPLAILSMQNLDKHFATPTVVSETSSRLQSEPQYDILTSRSHDRLTDINQDIQKALQQASQQDGKLDLQHDVNLDSKIAVQPDRQTTSKIVGKRAVRPTAPEPEVDPLDQALLQKLTRAYPELAREKSTLVSSRLPDDIVERLGYAADLVKKHRKNKQDVITRGLILAFEELVKSDGAVEWYEK